MMKFPVFKAFFATLGYVAAHFFTLVQILWLPSLLIIGANWAYMSATMDMQFALLSYGDGSADPSAPSVIPAELFGKAFLYAGAMYLAMAILYPMMFAGVLRHLVRGEAPKLPFYLRFGGDEFRILIAIVLLLLLFGVVFLVGMLALLALGVAAAAISEAVGVILMAVLPLALLIVGLWFALRLSVVFAAAVGERSIGIAESWRLTKGNAWGLFFFWLLFWLLLAAVSVLFFLVVAAGLGPLFIELFTAASSNNFEAIAEIQQRMLELQRDMIDLSRPGFWVYTIGAYLFTILYTALWAAAGGVAYRYLSAAAGDER